MIGLVRTILYITAVNILMLLFTKWHKIICIDSLIKEDI